MGTSGVMAVPPVQRSVEVNLPARAVLKAIFTRQVAPIAMVAPASQSDLAALNTA
jgi:hypothetical protein